MYLNRVQSTSKYGLSPKGPVLYAGIIYLHRLPWNNAGEQYYTHKNFHMQYLKPAGGRRQNRDFKAKAYTHQSSSTL